MISVYLLLDLSPFDYSYPIDTRWRINFVRHFYEYKKTKNCITKKKKQAASEHEMS